MKGGDGLKKKELFAVLVEDTDDQNCNISNRDVTNEITCSTKKHIDIICTLDFV